MNEISQNVDNLVKLLNVIFDDKDCVADVLNYITEKKKKERIGDGNKRPRIRISPPIYESDMSVRFKAIEENTI